MAFEGLSSRLQEITRKIRGKARITESDLKEMLREVKLALLEADVNYKIVNAIGDFDYPYDSERKLRPEIISNKRLIDTDSLVSLILSNCTEVEISKEELMMLNDKNSWTSVFAEINKNTIFENK